MTRGIMLDAMDKSKGISGNVYRRHTMTSAELRQFIPDCADPMGNMPAQNKPLPDFKISSPTSTRRMSIEAGKLEIENNDWESPRLDIEAFVVDYITDRVRKEGFEWFDAPELPYGPQPEHEMMRAMAYIFEKKNGNEIERFVEQLSASPKISFSLYQEVVSSLACPVGEPCAMPYGRLIGLISFGGVMATRMVRKVESRSQVRNLAIYTSLFIKSRLRSSWKEHKKNWAGFMELGVRMKGLYDEDVKKAKETRQTRRRWTVFGFSAAAVFGSVLAGRIIFGR